MIAHRKETIEKCDEVWNISNGELKKYIMKYKFGKAFKKVKKINLEIKNFTKKKHFESLIDYSKVFDLPRKVVEYETWSILSKNYDYKNSRLLKINSIKNFLKSFFFLITLALLNFFSFSLKKKISKKKNSIF